MYRENFITSWDDGGKDDVVLAKLLKKYGLPGIFYIPNSTQLSIDQITEIGKDFEVGGHTVNHPMDLKLLSDTDLIREIRDNRRWLQFITGQKVDKFCYPRGRYDDRVIQMVRLAGFTQGRGTVVLNTDLPDEPFRIKTTIHVYPDRKEYGGRKWYEVAAQLYEDYLSKKENGYFHLWGHSSELTKFNLWGELEDFFKRIQPIEKIEPNGGQLNE